MKRVNLLKAIIVALGLMLCLGAGLALSSGEGLLAQDARPLTVGGLSPAGISQWTPPSPAYRIAVEADGMYELDYNTLNTAGLPVGPGGLDPRTFRLFWMEQEMRIRVEGEGDGVFHAGDVVLFYGRSVDSLFYDGQLPTNKYTGANVYWLTYDPSGVVTGLRMAEKDGSVSGSVPGPFLHTEHLEQNFDYQSALPFQPDTDHWFWEYLVSSVPRNYAFIANNISSDGSLTGTLTVNLQGVSSVAHDLRIEVNGSEVLSSTAGWGWGGRAPFSTTVDVDQGYFQEGSNTVTLELISSSDSAFTNWLEVRYYDTYVAEGDVLAFSSPDANTYRYEVSNFSGNDVEEGVYDVSDMTAVQVFTSTTVTGSGPYTVTFGDVSAGNSRYLALTDAQRLSPVIEEVTHLSSPYTPSDLLDGGPGADYILITHSDFWTEAQTLAVHRDFDYRVAVIDVQEIYDHFNGGLMSAESIRDFLDYAYHNWQAPEPTYVLLLGDGTSDMRNYAGNSAPTYIPPFLALVDPTLGETATENHFVAIDGSDIMPDMHIGRLPASTAAEASAMVSKIIAYETLCVCNDWNRNVLFVADDLEGGGGNFYELSDDIADGYADPPTNTIKFLPSPYTSTKIYMGDTCDPGNPQWSVECKYDITHTLNVTGSLLVNYIGHSTVSAWARERLLDHWSLVSLDNNPCLPFVLAMTCFEGSFHDPPTIGWMSLAEDGVRMTEDGTIASWSATGFGVATGHDLLNQGIFLALFQDGVGDLGTATTQAKEYLDAHQLAHQYDDLIETYILLGDPGLKIKNAANCPTGVCLAGFSARPHGDGVLVEWQTASERDMLGFRVLRSPSTSWGQGESPGGEFAPINEEPIFAVWSGSDQGASYAVFDDQAAAGGTYTYALEIITLGGHTSRHGVTEVHVGWRLRLPLVM